MSNKYVGRVSFKHLKEEEDLEAVVSKMAFDFACEVGDAVAPCFVYEEGDCGEPHAHFYFGSRKSRSSLERLLKKWFKLPPKVCACVGLSDSKKATYSLCCHVTSLRHVTSCVRVCFFFCRLTL